MGADGVANFPGKGNEVAFLHTLDDGTSRQDYSYAVFAYQVTNLYNIQQGRLQLTVFEQNKDGSYNPVQHITVPDGTTINKKEKEVYFFGCLRPNTNKIDMVNYGFYNEDQKIKNTGYTVNDSELCEKLRTTRH